MHLFFSLHFKKSINFWLEDNSMQLEILGIKYKRNYASVFAQGQDPPVGEFSLHNKNAVRSDFQGLL